MSCLLGPVMPGQWQRAPHLKPVRPAAADRSELANQIAFIKNLRHPALPGEAHHSHCSNPPHRPPEAT